MVKKEILLLVCGLLWARGMNASVVDSTVTHEVPPLTMVADSVFADSIVIDSTKQVKTKNPIKWIARYLSNTNKHSDRPFDFSILVGPSYSAATSAGLGGTASGLYSWDRSDATLPKSNVSVFVNASLTGMLALGVRGNNFLPHDRYRLDYQTVISTIPSKFWGIGYQNGCRDAQESTYDRIKFQFKPSFLFRLSKREFLGVVMDVQTVNGYGFERPDLLMGQDKSVANFGLGLNFSIDTRDFVLNAYKGHYLRVEQMSYPQFLWNDYAFSYTDVTYSTYHRLGEKSVLAGEFHGLFNYGDVPWTMLAQVGVMGRMRGYYEGRYRDRQIIEAQVELRQRIKGRHGMTFWVGTANVFRYMSHLHLDRFLPNYGLGYRWEFKPRVNIRFDLGFTRDSPNFTFNINEAF